jgi:hypothetical protein
VLGVGLAALGLVTFASAHGGDTSLIHACVKDNNGGIHIVGADEQCKNNETALDWNQTGSQGATGPQGPAGPIGPQGEPGPAGSARAFAGIQPAGIGGAALRNPNKGFASVTHQPFFPGGDDIYCIVPAADSGLSPANSVLIVSLGTAGGSGAAGSSAAQVGICTDDVSGQFGWAVITWNASGSVSDFVPFSVMIP